MPTRLAASLGLSFTVLLTAASGSSADRLPAPSDAPVAGVADRTPLSAPFLLDGRELDPFPPYGTRSQPPSPAPDRLPALFDVGALDNTGPTPRPVAGPMRTLPRFAPRLPPCRPRW